jgi:hypothetical protein
MAYTFANMLHQKTGSGTHLAEKQNNSNDETPPLIQLSIYRRVCEKIVGAYLIKYYTERK